LIGRGRGDDSKDTQESTQYPRGRAIVIGFFRIIAVAIQVGHESFPTAGADWVLPRASRRPGHRPTRRASCRPKPPSGRGHNGQCLVTTITVVIVVSKALGQAPRLFSRKTGGLQKPCGLSR